VPSLWSSAAWPVEPPLVAVVLVGTLYWLGGRRRVSARRGIDRRAKSLSFYLGLFAILVALDSPLDPLADTLFTAHMAQHVLLLTVAPALIVLAAPWTQIWQPLPLGFRRTVAKAVVLHPRARPLRASVHALGHPLVAWMLFDVNLLLWHVPALYDLTLRSQAVHDLEHAMFFVTGLLFWAQVFDSAPFRARLSWLWRAAYTTVGMLVGWVLAVVLAFAPTPLYRAYASLPSRPGGLTALGDQQIAAGVMWVPGSIVYTIAILVFFYRWLAPEPQDGRAIAGGLLTPSIGGQ
jgi:cytochrome c oxidase assembly factor CtaG